MADIPSTSSDPALQDKFNTDVAIELRSLNVVLLAASDEPTYAEFVAYLKANL